MKAKKFISITLIVLLSNSLFSCYGLDRTRIENQVIDPALKMTREQFKNKLIPPIDSEKSKKRMIEPQIPDITSILASPAKPKVGPEKLISLSVTDDVPLNEVLMEMARLANVDVEIDPQIEGGIILRMTDRPFENVLERVVKLGHLRYSVIDGVIKIERDLPYQVNYDLDFLNMTRDNQTSISIDTQVLGVGAGGASGDSALTAGSSSSITSESSSNLWESIQTDLTAVMGYSAGDDNDNSANSSFQINQQAGVISIFATKRQHDVIKQYLDKVRKMASAQVLIEAKIVEVTLNEEYETGVDWGTLTDQTLGLQVASKFNPVSTTADFFTITGNSGKNLSTAMNFTEQFGVTRTLSSPRLHAMNNQQAILTFAENHVYYTLQVTEETDGTGADQVTTLNVESEPHSIPIGVMLTLQPSINLDTDEVTMYVRPTLTRITGQARDPGVDIIVARQTTDDSVEIKSEIPVVEIRELDSILKSRSGDIMVIGGLMREISSNTEKGVPYVNRTPFIGNLFKSKEESTQVIETIIFIKSTIIDPEEGSSYHQKDKEIYKNFIHDPRPAAF